MMATYDEMLAECVSLDDLLEMLTAVEADAAAGDDEAEHWADRRMSELPTFGGPEPPTGTWEVWSWDEERLLVGECAPFQIVPRSEWTGR
jgi:hypothetical protein